MATIDPIETQGVDSVAVSKDGSKVLFQFSTAQAEQPHSIVFPVPELPNLMMLASAASSDALKILTGDQHQRQVYPAQGWQVAETDDGRHFIFTFVLPGDMQLSFQLERDAAFNMSDVLNSKLGSIVSAVAKARQ